MIEALLLFAAVTATTGWLFWRCGESMFMRAWGVIALTIVLTLLGLPWRLAALYAVCMACGAWLWSTGPESPKVRP